MYDAFHPQIFDLKYPDSGYRCQGLCGSNGCLTLIRSTCVVKQRYYIRTSQWCSSVLHLQNYNWHLQVSCPKKSVLFLEWGRPFSDIMLGCIIRYPVKKWWILVDSFWGGRTSTIGYPCTHTHTHTVPPHTPHTPTPPTHTQTNKQT